MDVTFFQGRPTAEALNACISFKSESHWRQKNSTVTSYCKPVNSLLEMYATEDIIAETDANMTRLTKPSNKLLTEHAEALWKKALRCDRACDEYVLKGIFIEALLE